jgi:hypothetical protein
VFHIDGRALLFIVDMNKIPLPLSEFEDPIRTTDYNILSKKILYSFKQDRGLHIGTVDSNPTMKIFLTFT